MKANGEGDPRDFAIAKLELKLKKLTWAVHEAYHGGATDEQLEAAWRAGLTDAAEPA